jgi:hypothetical protein
MASGLTLLVVSGADFEWEPALIFAPDPFPWLPGPTAGTGGQKTDLTNPGPEL